MAIDRNTTAIVRDHQGKTVTDLRIVQMGKDLMTDNAEMAGLEKMDSKVKGRIKDGKTEQEAPLPQDVQADLKKTAALLIKLNFSALRLILLRQKLQNRQAELPKNPQGKARMRLVAASGIKTEARRISHINL
jgi:hypothetical protein